MIAIGEVLDFILSFWVLLSVEEISVPTKVLSTSWVLVSTGFTGPMAINPRKTLIY